LLVVRLGSDGDEEKADATNDTVDDRLLR
jgi:hypothetical protein